VAFQEEVQTIRLQSAPATPTVRVVTTTATPASEIQFVVITPGTPSVTGTFTLTLRGLTTVPISYAATIGVMQTAIQGLGTCGWSGPRGVGVGRSGWAAAFFERPKPRKWWPLAAHTPRPALISSPCPRSSTRLGY
jgi:hypothetical protein